MGRSTSDGDSRVAGALLAAALGAGCSSAANRAPAEVRVAPEAVIAALESAGLSARVSPVVLPDQYIVEAHQRP